MRYLVGEMPQESLPASKQHIAIANGVNCERGSTASVFPHYQGIYVDHVPGTVSTFAQINIVLLRVSLSYIQPGRTVLVFASLSTI